MNTKQVKQLKANIRRARESAGLTKADACRYLDVNPSYVSHMEGDREAIPSIEMLCAMAYVYDTRVSLLVKGV